MSVANNLKKIEDAIARTCKQAGRSPSEVHLIAVTKKQTLITMNEAYAAGLRHFGENYVQEAIEKQTQLAQSDLTWHLIGALQSNKIKDVVGRFEFIHSVDRWSLAEKIHHLAQQKSIRQKVFLQINFAGEDSKSGVSEGLAEELFFRMVQLEGLEICGLMIMPPFAEAAEESRPYFKKGQRFLDHLRSQSSVQGGSLQLRDLSMGTSQDYEIAIQEGATWIRLGSTLLGERVSS
jgi:pyridoxal phosphate enzyme (YggS family)